MMLNTIMKARTQLVSYLPGGHPLPPPSQPLSQVETTASLLNKLYYEASFVLCCTVFSTVVVSSSLGVVLASSLVSCPALSISSDVLFFLLLSHCGTMTVAGRLPWFGVEEPCGLGGRSCAHECACGRWEEEVPWLGVSKQMGLCRPTESSTQSLDLSRAAGAVCICRGTRSMK